MKAVALCLVALVLTFSSGGASNPLTAEGMFLSDPAGRVGPDGRLWIFGSRDTSVRSFCCPDNDALETSDMREWRIHPGVFNSHRLVDVETVLYAPDAFFHEGRWWLFYCTPSKHAEGVASSLHPQGPYGEPRRYAFADQIDPSVFRDDDGTVYYTWGQFSMKCAILKPDLSGFVHGTLHDNVIDEKNHHFHEGSQLFKRKGVYYLAFADIGREYPSLENAYLTKRWGNHRPTCIGYATASSPFGPYTYRGVIVDNYGCDPAVWNNHGSVVEFGGKWYVFYHRSTNGSSKMRKACVEPIEFDENGCIREVEMTSHGVGDPLDPFVRTEARLACLMSGHVRIETLSDGQERLGGIRGGDTATWRYFDFTRAAASLELEFIPDAGGRIVVSDSRGIRLGEGTVGSGDGRTVRTVTVPLQVGAVAGKTAIRLTFESSEESNFGALESFVFH